ncbi:MAG: HAD family hydrolase [Rhodospirillales bacterium]
MDLIIFDCDGVLVDSELIASREMARFVTDLGMPMTAETCRARFTGLSIATVAGQLRAEGLVLPDDFESELRARDAAAFEAELAPVEGVADTLRRLVGTGRRICVASSGSPQKIRHSLDHCGLTAFFGGDLFSATEVACGKPAPDLFLHACDRMGVAPSRALVIEDSLAGVKGARAAGIRVFGFTGAGHCEPGHDFRLLDAGAERCYDRMAELPSLLSIA